MQFRTVLDVKVVDVEKRRNPSKHYVSCLPQLDQCPSYLFPSIHLENCNLIHFLAVIERTMAQPVTDDTF